MSETEKQTSPTEKTKTLIKNLKNADDLREKLDIAQDILHFQHSETRQLLQKALEGEQDKDNRALILATLKECD